MTVVPVGVRPGPSKPPPDRALLRIFPEARTIAALAAHVAAGAAVYFAALALLYAPTLVQILRPRPQHSEA